MKLLVLLFLYTSIHAIEKNENNACLHIEDYPKASTNQNCYYNPSVLTNTSNLVEINGYLVEEHYITTGDGYRMTLFRIPTQNVQKNRKPVFVLHGILSSAAIWAAFGERSLAFNLANEGYDTWLGTIRGTTGSQEHSNYEISSKEYWNFDFETIVQNDYSDQIEYISKRTQSSGKITCIGFSMGGALSFLYAAEKAEVASKLTDGIIGLAPIVHLDHSTFVQNVLVPLNRFTLPFLPNHAFFEINGTHSAFVTLCAKQPHICVAVIRRFYADFNRFFKPPDFLAFLSYCPDAIGKKMLLNYFQWALNKRVAKFDYGPLKNMQIYNSTLPPKYDFSKIEVPCYLFYGAKDILGGEKNTQMLFDELQCEKKEILEITRKGGYKFGHLDFSTAPRGIRKNLFVEIFRALNEIRAG